MDWGEKEMACRKGGCKIKEKRFKVWRRKLNQTSDNNVNIEVELTYAVNSLGFIESTRGKRIKMESGNIPYLITVTDS